MQRAAVGRRAGTTTVSSVGGANVVRRVGPVRGADRVADADAAEAPQLADLARGDGVARARTAPPSNTLIAVTFAVPSSRSRDAQRARRTCARRRSSPPPAPRSILNTVPRGGPSASPLGGRQQLARSRPISASTPAPVRAEPEKTGCTRAAPGLRGERARAAARPASRRRPRGRRRAARRRARRAPRRAAARRRRRDGGRAQLARDLAAAPRSRSRAAAVDLVDEDQRRHRSRCSARISTRVCACTPSTAETTSTAPSSTPSTRSTSAMKSGWPGRVDQVDGDVADRERDDRGLDRDAALPLQRERVGLRVAGVDAAELVDDAGRRGAAAR